MRYIVCLWNGGKAPLKIATHSSLGRAESQRTRWRKRYPDMGVTITEDIWHDDADEYTADLDYSSDVHDEDSPAHFDRFIAGDR